MIIMELERQNLIFEFIVRPPFGTRAMPSGVAFVLQFLGGERSRGMNLKRLAYKLQTALLQQGMKVKINQFQSYSEQNKRMITKYVLTIPIESGNQIKNKTVLESYSLSEVVQKLAELLRGDGS